FLPLYIDTLGNFTHKQLNFWSGFIYSGTYFVSAIISLWWGKLADKKGRKPMTLRASLGMAIVLGCMGLATDVLLVFIVGMVLGVFAGFVSNCNALVATEPPKERSGQALGTMASSFTAGNLLGPFIGGALAPIFAYRVAFFSTCGLFLIALF